MSAEDRLEPAGDSAQPPAQQPRPV